MADLNNKRSLNGPTSQESSNISYIHTDRSPSGRSTFQFEIKGNQECVSIPSEELAESCRLCMRRKGTITIFERADSRLEKSFSDLLASLYLLDVEKNDRLPQKICESCAALVNQFYYFKDQIKKAQDILNASLGGIEVSNDSSAKTTDGMTDLFHKDVFDIFDSDNVNEIEIESSDYVNEIEIETSENINDICHVKSTGIIDDVKVNNETPNSDNAKKFTCHFCGKIFSDKRRFLYHRAGEYRKKKIQMFGKTMIPCSICQKSIVKNRIEDHMNTHTKARPYVCEKCGKSYRSKSNFYDHKQIHKETEPQICQLCGKIFTLDTKLKMHLKWHKEEASYVCHVCGRVFYSTSSFKLHHKLHRLGNEDFRAPEHSEVGSRTAKRPFECTECGKKFIYSSHLSDHKILHTGEKPFECFNCGKRFALKGNLKQHSRTHTKDKRHCCDICHKTFYTNSSLKKHKTIHDKENDTDRKKGQNVEDYY